MMQNAPSAKQIPCVRVGRKPKWDFWCRRDLLGLDWELWIFCYALWRLHVLLGQNCNISLLMLVLLKSYVGFSVVTADQFNALFSVPCITKTTTNFACKPEFEENAALVLMVLGPQLHSLALFFRFCHSSEILLFSRLRAALAFSLHSLLPCQKHKQNFKRASFPLFSTLVHNDVTYCFIARVPAPAKLIVVHNAS